MKKGYHDYIPIVKKEKKGNKITKCPFTGLIHPPGTKFVTECSFKMMFGWEYPKVSIARGFKYIEPITYPKQSGNGKNSRFR